MNESTFQKALQTVQNRRFQAISENESRHREIAQKIPEIANINQQLAQTSIKILEIVQQGGDIKAKMESLKRDNLEAQQYCKMLLQQYGYPPDYLDIHYTCEKCQDTGYCEGTYCDCLRSAIASVGIAQMSQHIPLKNSFEQFSLDYYRGITTPDGRDCYEIMKRIYNYCIQYASRFSKNSDSLLFYGLTGLGKTHLSRSIANVVLELGYEVIYDSVLNLLKRIEDEHFKKSESDIDTLALLLDADLLILDDLGTEFSSSFNISTLYNIINTRINKSLPTIINTNLSNIEITQKYHERIVSRLFASYKPFQFVGNDIRQLKIQKKV